MNYATDLSCGAAIVLTSAMAAEQRTSCLVRLYVLQSGAVALICLGAAWDTRSAPLYFAGAFALAVKGFVIPVALVRFVQRTERGVRLSAAAGPAAFVFSSLVSGAMNSPQSARALFAVALSVILTGLIIIALRQAALFRILGFLCVENGLMLAGAGVAGTSLWFELIIATCSLLLLVMLASPRLRAVAGDR